MDETRSGLSRRHSIRTAISRCASVSFVLPLVAPRLSSSATSGLTPSASAFALAFFQRKSLCSVTRSPSYCCGSSSMNFATLFWDLCRSNRSSTSSFCRVFNCCRFEALRYAFMSGAVFSFFASKMPVSGGENAVGSPASSYTGVSGSIRPSFIAAPSSVSGTAIRSFLPPFPVPFR